MTERDLIQRAERVLTDAGLVLGRRGLDVSGKLAMCGTTHKPNGTDGRYVVHLDFPPNVWVCNYHNGGWQQTVKLYEQSQMDDLSDAERQKLHERIRQRQEASKKERAKELKLAAKRAKWIWDNSLPATEDNAYLRRQGVKPCGNLRQAGDGRLVVPVFNERGKLASIQLIAGNKEKRFLQFTLPDVFYFAIPAQDGRKEGPLLICEGVADGLSLHWARGDAVLVSLNAHRLKSVAEFARKKYPGREIVIFADYDRPCPGYPDAGGTGVACARKAATAIGAKLAICPLWDGRDKADFNDLWQDLGPERVKAEIEKALAGNPAGENEGGLEIVSSDANKDTKPTLSTTEDGLAVRFVTKHKVNMRYCHDRGKWYIWNGQIWKMETTQEGLDRIRIVCKEAAKSVEIKDRKRLLRAQLFSNVDKIARTDRAVAVTSKVWDKDKFLLGTPNGTVDLRTGKLRQAKAADYITKSTSVAPDSNSTPHLWLKFLDETTGGDKGLQRFLQQVCGMVLTGDTTEHILTFVYGPGGNGKSVFLTVLTEILADYAANAPMETFTATGTDRHPTELAMLRGARLVTASETEEGRYWAESKIKQLTGGDLITARFMRQDFFQYVPQFKLVIIGNHKPSIRTLDDALKRRINIIPFTQKPQKVDRYLSEKLRVEYPGILKWMIIGCLDWQANGLQRPECVRTATDDYFADQDIFSQWITECCNVHAQFSGKSSILFASWKQFAEQNGIRPGNSKTFKSSMDRRGFKNKHSNTGWAYLGICLKPQGVEIGLSQD